MINWCNELKKDYFNNIQNELSIGNQNKIVKGVFVTTIVDAIMQLENKKTQLFAIGHLINRNKLAYLQKKYNENRKSKGKKPKSESYSFGSNDEVQPMIDECVIAQIFEPKIGARESDDGLSTIYFVYYLFHNQFKMDHLKKYAGFYYQEMFDMSNDFYKPSRAVKSQTLGNLSSQPNESLLEAARVQQNVSLMEARAEIERLNKLIEDS